MKTFVAKLAACAAIFALFIAAASAQDMSIAVSSQQVSELFPEGNPYYTATSTVAVSWLDIPAGAVSFAITEIDDSSGAQWQSEYPLSHPITGGEGAVTLYAWAKDAAEALVAQASDSIVYSETTGVTITNLVTIPDAHSVQIAYDTVDAGEESVETAGWVAWRRSGTSEWSTAGSPVHFFTHEFVVDGLVDSTEYEFVMYANDTSLSSPQTTSGATPTEGNVAWTGAGVPDLRWRIGSNWAGLQPPANPTTATVTFGAAGTSDELVKLVAPIIPAEPESGVPADTWRIGTLSLTNTSGKHIIDLGEKTLDVANDVQSNSAAVTNGTLKVGRDLYINRSTLDLDGTTLSGNFRELRAAGSSAALDLRGATVDGGTLELQTLTLGRRGNVGYLYIDSTTGIDTLAVKGNATLGYQQASRGYIGYQDPNRNNDWYLPAGMNLIFGDRDAATPEFPDAGRGVLQIAITDGGGYGNSRGRLAVSGGGEFDAWLTELVVGYHDQRYQGGDTGTLDLRGVGVSRPFV